MSDNENENKNFAVATYMMLNYISQWNGVHQPNFGVCLIISLTEVYFRIHPQAHHMHLLL